MLEEAPLGGGLGRKNAFGRRTAGATLGARRTNARARIANDPGSVNLSSPPQGSSLSRYLSSLGGSRSVQRSPSIVPQIRMPSGPYP